MPGQRGSENRQRPHVVNSRWSPEELQLLNELADATGLGKAETLRQLVRRANRNLPTVRATTNTLVKVGNLMLRIAKHADATGEIARDRLLETKADLDVLIRDLRR